MPIKGAPEPGARDRWITIEQRDPDAVDSAGAPIESWSALVSLPASKVDSGGTERFTAEQMASKFDTSWVVNYRLDIDPELVDVPTLRRVIHNGRQHDIVAAFHLGRREGIELLTLASTKAA